MRSIRWTKEQHRLLTQHLHHSIEVVPQRQKYKIGLRFIITEIIPNKISNTVFFSTLHL